MKVAILGYGIDGKVSAEYWANNGDEVTICDQKPGLKAPDKFQTRLGPDHMRNLHDFDLIVRTSGIHPRTILEANPDHHEIAARITNGMAEFLRVCPSPKLIGITGSKGKGTTSTLVTKILQAAGKTVHLGGNIGIAALEMLPKIKPDDFVVLELSSFQLIDNRQRVPTAACLMMAPEHLNWHTDMAEYYEAKAQLFVHQLPEDRAIYNARDKGSQEIVFRSPATIKQGYEVPPDNEPTAHKDGGYVEGDSIYYQDTEIMPIKDVKLLGRHNLENVCAAITIVWPFIDGNLDAIRQVVSTFTGLPHHTEYVTTIDDVIYYNDSYSTMPDATIAALQAIPGKKVLILGGGSKNLPLDNMIEAVAKADLRHIVLMGSLAKELEKMLIAKGVTNYSFSTNGMADIITEAKKYAQPGDIVLLSPGLPAKGDGFFIDNVDRGNQYKACLGVAVTNHH